MHRFAPVTLWVVRLFQSVGWFIFRERIERSRVVL